MNENKELEFKCWVAGVGIGELLDDLQKAESDNRFMRVVLASSLIMNALLIAKFVLMY